MTDHALGYQAAADQQMIRAILCDRPVAYHPMLAKALGGVTAGLFLSQLLYWSPRGHDPSGWIYKTQAEWEEETGLTRLEQETARRHLRDAGVLEEKREGLPARLFYRVDFTALVAKLECGKPTYWDVGNPQSRESVSDIHTIEQRVPTEITTEIPLSKRSRKVTIAQNIIQPDRAKLHQLWDTILGTTLVDDQIDLALNHRASKGYTNLHLYVNNWLRKEAASPAHRPPSRNGAPAPVAKSHPTVRLSPPMSPEERARGEKLLAQDRERERAKTTT